MSRIMLAGVICTAAFISATARADFTPISGPFPGELGHEAILEGIYGGDFTASGLDFSNGAITATRMDDGGLAGIANVVNGGPGLTTDQVWDDGFVQAVASARYTLLPGQTIGFRPGASGGAFIPLFSVGGYGFNVTGSTNLLDARGQTWQWAHARPTLTGLRVHSSRENQNPGNLDYMVTYQITGVNDGWTRWLMFWDDAVPGGDYNDVVVEVKAVPSPGAAALGLIGLGAIGLPRRRNLARS